MKKILTIVSLLITINNAEVLTGYFGYEDPIIENEDNKTKLTTPQTEDLKYEKLLQKAIKNPRSLTASQFKEVQAYAKDKAVMQQDEKSIKNWMILNNFTIRNADTFQKMQKVVLFKNPELYEEGDLARSGFAQKTQTQAAAQKQNSLIKSLTSKIAIFAFFGNEEASVKSSQERVLWFVQQDYPQMTIINADIRQNRGLYEKLGEKLTPSLWMAYRDVLGKAHWYRIIGGVATKNQILDNIQFIYENIIKKELEL